MTDQDGTRFPGTDDGVETGAEENASSTAQASGHTGPVSNQGPLVISSEDLESESVTARVHEMERGQHVALVRDVGAPEQSRTRSALIAVGTLAAGGLVGGILSFAVIRTVLSNRFFESSSTLNNISFSFVLATLIGVSVALADIVAARTWSKLGRAAAFTVPAAVIAGLVIGLIANVFYSAAIEWLYDSALTAAIRGDWSSERLESYVLLRMHPIRGFAWLLVGVAAGIAAGAAARSWKRLGLAVIGGAVGGFLGGFLFDFFPGEWIAQLVGVCLLGVLIGTATGIVEQAAKSRWIEIVTGGLAGKQFILYQPRVTMGSSPTADITLIKDPAIGPIAALMTATGQGASIKSAAPDHPIVVDGRAVTEAALTDGVIVTLGSTQIRFREKASKTQIPAGLNG